MGWGKSSPGLLALRHVGGTVCRKLTHVGERVLGGRLAKSKGVGQLAAVSAFENHALTLQGSQSGILHQYEKEKWKCGCITT